MPEQKKNLIKKKYGGTMRLGAYPCKLNPKGLSYKAYKSSLISERHRHRYELNNEFKELLEKKGMLMAVIGVQFHPEFKSRPLKPHPLFRGFIKSSIKKCA